MTEFEPQLELKPLPKIPLPQGWSELVLLALLHVITLAKVARLMKSISKCGLQIPCRELKRESASNIQVPVPNREP